ncbi:MAG: hypothetical protein DYG92_08645 [Leptolyngbya sp. PLA1]|nr:hypothetical protein [Leptolyngbya sp. PLA1]
MAPIAVAQPEEYTDLGSRLTAQTLEVPILLDSGDDIKWFLVELPTVEADAGFVEVFTPVPFQCAATGCPGFMGYPSVAVFNALGAQLAHDTTRGDMGDIRMSWGLGDPRPPICMVVDEYGNLGCNSPLAGENGVLDRGWYWIAIGNEFFVRADGWTVLPSRPASDPARHTTLTIRVSPPEASFCDGDFNWDGNTDQDDVLYLANVLAGGENPTGRWADYNRDGNEDQDDLLALVHTIAGGGCP